MITCCVEMRIRADVLAVYFLSSRFLSLQFLPRFLSEIGYGVFVDVDENSGWELIRFYVTHAIIDSAHWSNSLLPPLLCNLSVSFSFWGKM